MPSRLLRRSLSFVALRTVRVAAALLLAAGVASGAHAQNGKSANERADSHLDFYGGYGYLRPFNASGINGYQYQPVSNPNATASITGWFNHYFGVQVEGSYFSGAGEHHQYLNPCASTSCDQLVYTAEGGLAGRLPLGRFVPFAHVLGGGERTNGPAAQNLVWGWGVTGGLGVDYVLPFFHDLLAVRPVQADYQYSQVQHGPLVLPAGISGGLGTLNNVKLSGGLVLRVGEKEEKQPVMLGCAAEPVSVHPGDTVTITGSTLYLNPKRTTQYTWTSNGGKLTPSGATTTVDTTGLTPGEYTVEGHVSQGSKANLQASCTAPFTVLPIEPPSVTCTATPPTATSGTTIDISTTGTSPQNRPLTYSYTTTAGQITGTGATAKLSTNGLDATTITVGCNVVDDQGQSAKSRTTVTIEKPELPQLPETQTLCTINFDRDKRRPVRVDNESKACLDDIALAMGQQSSAKLVIIGNAAPSEPPEAAAQRALNERQYLTDEKGIDKARTEVRVGDTSGRTVRNILVPTGAVFNEAVTQTFDESAIQRPGQAYGTGHTQAAPSASARRGHRRPLRRKAAPAADATTPAPSV